MHGHHPTLAQINSAIERFREVDKDRFTILYFGDLDSVGKSMCRYLREQFPELRCPNVSVEEIAVNVPQVEDLDLPTIPLKRHTTEEWYKETYGVEIDAIPPNILKQTIRESIENFLDVEEIERKKEEDKANIERIKEQLREIRGDHYTFD